MTKSQIIYYAAAVIAIIIGVYLYTSVAEAPHKETKAEVETATSTPISPTTPVVEGTIESTVVSNALASTTWRWLRTEDAKGTLVAQPKTDRPFVLSFQGDTSMGSQTDCNSLGGSYTTEGNALTFGPLMMTKMFCEDSQEQIYADQLSQVVAFTLINNMLRLSLGTASGTMYFVQVAQ